MKQYPCCQSCSLIQPSTWVSKSSIYTWLLTLTPWGMTIKGVFKPLSHTPPQTMTLAGCWRIKHVLKLRGMSSMLAQYKRSFCRLWVCSTVNIFSSVHMTSGRGLALRKDLIFFASCHPLQHCGLRKHLPLHEFIASHIQITFEHPPHGSPGDIELFCHGCQVPVRIPLQPLSDSFDELAASDRSFSWPSGFVTGWSCFFKARNDAMDCGFGLQKSWSNYPFTQSSFVKGHDFVSDFFFLNHGGVCQDIGAKLCTNNKTL